MILSLCSRYPLEYRGAAATLDKGLDSAAEGSRISLPQRCSHGEKGKLRKSFISGVGGGGAQLVFILLFKLESIKGKLRSL